MQSIHNDKNYFDREKGHNTELVKTPSRKNQQKVPIILTNR
jgi:hypothetical protein